MIDNGMALRQALSALASGSTIELLERTTEEHFCILTPESAERFRAEAGKLYEQVQALQMALDDAKRALARLNAQAKQAGPNHSALANKLLMSPPQGMFPFTGRLVFLRDFGATIQLDDEGSPIPETWRKATDAERAWVSKQDEEASQLDLFDAPVSEPTPKPLDTTSEALPFE